MTTVDRFGQTWRLELTSNGFVTYRVAAKLLGVSVASLYNWEEKLFKPVLRKEVKLMKMHDLLRLAHQRGLTDSPEG